MCATTQPLHCQHYLSSQRFQYEVLKGSKFESPVGKVFHPCTYLAAPAVSATCVPGVAVAREHNIASKEKRVVERVRDFAYDVPRLGDPRCES